MINTIYVNGCSWSAGDEINTDDKFKNYLIQNNLNLSKENNWDIYDNDNKLVGYVSDFYQIFNWGGVLKKKLNVQKYINNSLGGGSNERIFRETLDFIINYPEENRKNLLVIIGWTCADRKEIYFKVKNSWERFNPTMKFSETLDKHKKDSLSEHNIELYDRFHYDYNTLIFDEYERLDSYLKQIYSLSNILEYLNIKYYFFESFTYVGGLKETLNKNPQHFKNWVDWFENNNKILKETNMLNFVNEKKLKIGEYLHPLIDGHEKWGEYLHTKIKELYDV
jgi:hypothetical protein